MSWRARLGNGKEKHHAIYFIFFLIFGSSWCDFSLFISSIDKVYDGFRSAQSARTKKSPIEAIVHPFVSKIETAPNSMTTDGPNEATGSAPEPKMRMDVFDDTATQSSEAMPAIEIKKGKQTISQYGFSWGYD